MNSKRILFLLFNLLTIGLFGNPLRELISLSFQSELYSHVMIIPLVSGYFFYTKRNALSLAGGFSFVLGPIIILTGLAVYSIGLNLGGNLNSNDRLAFMISSAVVFWVGGFIFFYGHNAIGIAAFPLLFLFFLTPIPSRVVETVISLLQIGSTETTYGFFRLTGVPVLREGFTFHLTGMSIEVAKQCSGIRSSIALFITSIIAGQLFLRTGWKRVVLALSIFPITVFKNGLRIVTLSLLGTYVDPRILDSELHKSGGIPFFILALALLAPVLWVLRKSEGQEKGARAKVKGLRMEAKS
jgi:exosortase